MIKDKALKLVNELIAENKALKAALAQPAQEPVVWVTKKNVIVDGLWEEEITFSEFDDGGDPVYYTPQQRPWVGLTDYEIGVCSTDAAMNRSEMVGGAVTFARAIEAKLKEKNT
jgi:hypothetical protein